MSGTKSHRTGIEGKSGQVTLERAGTVRSEVHIVRYGIKSSRPAQISIYIEPYRAIGWIRITYLARK